MPSQGWRSAPLPKGWTRTRRRILRRDHYTCQWELAAGGRCGEPATDVDHIIPVSQGGTDTDDNLQALCEYHHIRKSRSEAAAVSHAKPPRKRPQEKHPGLLN